jgi:glycosyltransferase involved in cell wall biosynthesis
LPLRTDIIQLPNAIDCQNYAFRLRQNAQPRLLWLRAFHRIYEPMLAPRVLERLSNAFPESRLTMIGKDKGDGSLAETRTAADRLGVLNRCDFLPAVPKQCVPEALQNGDIYLNTSTIDNAPVSVIEAAASGLCIVSTNVGGIPHLLTARRDALLVPPGDEDLMAESVREVLTVPGLAETLSSNARQTALQFDWQNVLPQWQDLIAACTPKVALL